jgi:hypothetical protein
MNKRKQKRFAISLHADIFIGKKTYKGLIGNISEEGVLYSLTTFIQTDDKFLPQKNVGLNFDLPSGEKVDLNCEVRWFIKPLEKGKALMLGLYIIDPPSEYTEWLKKFK